MILDTETLAHISSYYSGEGKIDLELEEEAPELGESQGQQILFLANYCSNLVMVKGRVASYEKVEPDPDVPEQDVFARVSFKDCMSLSIDFGS